VSRDQPDKESVGHRAIQQHHIVKLLSDKRELDVPYRRIAL
jgi:hypothetical protein